MHWVELTTITEGAGAHKGKTAEQMLLYQARVSSARDDANKYDDVGLIRWLLKQEPPHISPFQMVGMGLEIKCALDVADQFKRHWSIAIAEPLNIQQYSMRYAEAHSVDELEFRTQGKTNRQISDGPHDMNADFKERAEFLLSANTRLYEEMIDAGVAKECARRILPVATMTGFFVQGSLRSWLSYLWQRNHEHAQKEHRLLAADILQIARENFPATMEAAL